MIILRTGLIESNFRANIRSLFFIDVVAMVSYLPSLSAGWVPCVPKAANAIFSLHSVDKIDDHTQPERLKQTDNIQYTSSFLSIIAFSSERIRAALGTSNWGVSNLPNLSVINLSWKRRPLEFSNEKNPHTESTNMC